MIDNITLQINLSPGDIAYASKTVPGLIKKHTDIQNRLLVVDCCRPQKTKLLDPDEKFPMEAFRKKVDIIIEIAEKFLKEGLVTDVYYLKPGDPLFNRLSKKYLNGLYSCTHGAGGTANMGYWAAIDLPQTKYVLHYDGDMLLYQKPGYNWVTESLKYLDDSEDFISAIPLLSPPIDDLSFDLPSFHEYRPVVSRPQYWYNDFFSTRAFLLDKEKLGPYLPLVRGKLMFELLLRKFGRRAFPLDPEIILFRSLGSRGGYRTVSKNRNAWLTHPIDKSSLFINALPQIIQAVNAGEYPDEQKGYEDMNLPAWIDFLNSGGTK